MLNNSKIHISEIEIISANPEKINQEPPCRWSVLIILFSLISICYSSSESYIAIKRFSVDSTVDSSWRTLGRELYQRLNFELLPRGIKPLLLSDSIPSSCVAVASGSIRIVDSLPVLNFRIVNIRQNEEDVKKLVIEDYTVDEIIDILALKVHHFLEQNVSGKLRLSSTPLDCDVYLNGIKIGKTPAELILEPGTYKIQLHREYLQTYKNSVTITPGREVSLSPVMRFHGLDTKPWFISALVFTGCTIIAQVIELHYEKEYNALKYYNTLAEFNRHFNNYRYANIAKVALLIPTATTWTLSGYSFLENKALKRKIFSEN
jgi:hypothetical protein